jgi:hypothetical protein
LHVLFVARDAGLAESQWLNAVQRRPILTVTEAGVVDHRSVIDFVIVEGRVRFRISLPAANLQGLQLSSRLLSVTYAVRTEAQ